MKPVQLMTASRTSVYWNITTMTTVGLGDITPQTDLGRLISSAMMLHGRGTLAAPIGILTAEKASHRLGHTGQITTQTCHQCLREGHLVNAQHCFQCGAHTPDYQHEKQD